MQKPLLLLLFLFVVSYAETATQTDWSGGGGVPGPVTNWDDSYDVANQINDTGYLLRLASVILGSPVENTVDGGFDGVISVFAADIDGDGDTDVLGAGNIAYDITWWENTDGTGTSWTEHTIDPDFPSARSVYAADLDGDGDTDVLGASGGGQSIHWWENTDGTGTSWTRRSVAGYTGYGSSVFATDMDGDDDIDVIGCVSNDVSWWENIDGSGISWTEHIVEESFDAAGQVCATDVDGDGDIDLLGSAYYGNAMVWWENTDGTGTSWTVNTVDDSFEYAASVSAADVDEDGDIDVLGAAETDDDITWWENTDGSGATWAEHTIEGNFDGAFAVYATDIDGDGFTDVLGAARFADDITWWENSDTDPGIYWTSHTVDDSFNGAMSVYATDIDGDGDTDILGGALEADEIAWWDVMGFSASGSLESSILDAGAVDHWDDFFFTQLESTGTSMGFQFRSSQDSANMGEWSDTIATNTSLYGVLTDSTDFLQYRVILQSTDPQNTPLLYDLSFSFTTYLGISDNDVSEWDLEPSANPSFGNLAVQVFAPQPGVIDFVLHDISGRVITRYSQELPDGVHSVSFNNLAEGVYFCTMRAGDFTATEQIVVLK